MIDKQSYHNEIVWVIGASTGIGAALAKEISKRGGKLILSARRIEELNKLKESLSNSLEHKVYKLDITDEVALRDVANAIYSEFGSIDRVIFMAAAYTPMKLANFDIEVTKQIIEVNLLGAFNVINAILPILEKQSYSQIALCGSVAGYFGLPNAQPYGATKAAIINLAESLRSELPPKIDVKLINPGFVKTELTDKNNFDMPMIISADKAAKYIADGLLDSKFEIHFPKRFTVWLKLLKLLPYFLSLKISKRIIG